MESDTDKKQNNYTLQKAFIDIQELHTKYSQLAIRVEAMISSVEFLKTWIDHSYEKNKTLLSAEIADIKSITTNISTQLSSRLPALKKTDAVTMDFTKLKEKKNKKSGK